LPTPFQFFHNDNYLPFLVPVPLQAGHLFFLINFIILLDP